ncbi:hypothetical protein ONR75_27645 [Rhodopseudomonas sp. P2A-2r]|nr:hypothetical protein ONR75_27645 [Rhodopseudomonas sp. P2A-2r]
MRLSLEMEAHKKRYYQDDAPAVSDADYDALRRRVEAIEAKFPELAPQVLVERLTEEEAEMELRRLAAEIAAHDKRYYQQDAPTISDAEYDRLRVRNKEIEERFPDLRTLFSPSFLVGASPRKGFRELRHAVPMLSLDNAFSDKDLEEFVARVRRSLKRPSDEVIAFTAEPKIDGLSMSLRYEDGLLVTGATRGDKITGEDVTANIATLKEIPKKLTSENVPNICEIRGEIYMSHSEFFELNKRQAEAGKKVFANPRNAASGSLLQKTQQLRRHDH